MVFVHYILTSWKISVLVLIIIVDASYVQKIPVKSDRRLSRQHLHASVGMHQKDEQIIAAKWWPFAFIWWQSRLLPKVGGGRNWKFCAFNLPVTSLFVAYWLLGGYNLQLLNGSLQLKGGGRIYCAKCFDRFLSFTLLFLSESLLVKGGGRDFGYNVLIALELLHSTFPQSKPPGKRWWAGFRIAADIQGLFSGPAFSKPLRTTVCSGCSSSVPKCCNECYTFYSVLC